MSPSSAPDPLFTSLLATLSTYLKEAGSPFFIAMSHCYYDSTGASEYILRADGALLSLEGKDSGFTSLSDLQTSQEPSRHQRRQSTDASLLRQNRTILANIIGNLEVMPEAGYELMRSRLRRDLRAYPLVDLKPDLSFAELFDLLHTSPGFLLQNNENKPKLRNEGSLDTFLAKQDIKVSRLILTPENSFSWAIDVVAKKGETLKGFYGRDPMIIELEEGFIEVPQNTSLMEYLPPVPSKKRGPSA